MEKHIKPLLTPNTPSRKDFFAFSAVNSCEYHSINKIGYYTERISVAAFCTHTQLS